MSELVTWPGEGLPLKVEYARDVLERLRESAVRGLMDLPKVGIGSGGMLLGERNGDQVTILDSFEIPCSHAHGASFSLTEGEQEQARRLIGQFASGHPIFERGVSEQGDSEQGGADQSLTPIGWYVSKGLRPLELTDSDEAMLAGLFPEGWQFGLLIQPNVAKPSQIVSIFRDSSGKLSRGETIELAPESVAMSVPRESVAEAPERVESTALQAAPEGDVFHDLIAPDTSVEPVAPLEPAGAVAFEGAAIVRSAEPVYAEREVFHAAPEPAPYYPVMNYPAVTARVEGGNAGKSFDDELLSVARCVRAGNRLRWKGWALAAAILLIAAGAFTVLKDRPSTPPEPMTPPLVLRSSEANGMLVIRWSNEAVKDVDHGSLFINDGGRLHSFALTRAQLDAGEWRYARKFPRVKAVLMAGKAQGEISFVVPVRKRKAVEAGSAVPEGGPQPWGLQ